MQDLAERLQQMLEVKERSIGEASCFCRAEVEALVALNDVLDRVLALPRVRVFLKTKE
ncbi:MAG: hypothetical protein HY347_09085 [candidate division NC10 bacterium]|nr:hypothetical protein [candidate division NC10 bacterium]